MCVWGGGVNAEYIYIILAAKYFHKHLNCNLSRCYFNSRNNIPPTPQQNISLAGTVQYLAQKVYTSIVCHPLVITSSDCHAVEDCLAGRMR